MMRTSLSIAAAVLLPMVCLAAPGVDESPLPVQVEAAFPKLRFVRPIVLTHAGDDTNRVFVASQLGAIHVFPNDQNVAKTRVFLDISKQVVYHDKMNEEGLL